MANPTVSPVFGAAPAAARNLTSSLQADLISQWQAGPDSLRTNRVRRRTFLNNNVVMELIAESKQAHEHIERCAYLIWEQEGRPVGRALEHWVQAEPELLARGHRRSAPDEVQSETGANSSESPRRSRYGLVLTQNHAA